MTVCSGPNRKNGALFASYQATVPPDSYNSHIILNINIKGYSRAASSSSGRGRGLYIYFGSG